MVLVTVSAINRSAFLWFERNFTFLATVSTGCFMHFSRSKRPSVSEIWHFVFNSYFEHFKSEDLHVLYRKHENESL